jgi:hypothetical protein
VVPPVQGLPLPAQESVASLQDSVPLQNNPSLGQLTGVPGMQIPASHVSSPLQYIPSSQSATIEHSVASQVFASSLQTVPSVQGLPLLKQELVTSLQDSAPLQKVPSSGQSTGLPVWHPLTGSQLSFPLQNCPSLQRPLSGECMQLSVASSQLSAVQSTLSLQLTGAPVWQLFATHVSWPLQYIPSPQSASAKHGVTKQKSMSSLHTVPSAQTLPLLRQESVASSQDSAPVQNKTSSGQLTGMPG